MKKLYAFWKYDTPPYLLGGEVTEVTDDGYVTIVGYAGYKFKPIAIVSLKKGRKLQKKLDKAYAKYEKTIKIAKEELFYTVEEISKQNDIKKAWYLDEDILIEGYTDKRGFHPNRNIQCGFDTQEYSKKDIGKTIFFDLKNVDPKYRIIT